jgi:hypothetical protein
MKYEHIEKFATRVGKTRRTIYRFYNKNEDLREQTKIKNGKRFIPIEHKKFWNTEVLFDENKNLSDSNHNMRNLLDYLHDNRNPLANKLWGFDWSNFVSIDYKFERSKNYSITMMNKLYEMLDEKFGDNTTIRIFFTTEPFANRNNGQHNHMMIYIKNEVFTKLVLNEIKRFFKNDRVDSSKYNKYKGGLFYMMKEGMQGVDWDILGNKLEKEGIGYENKGYTKAV